MVLQSYTCRHANPSEHPKSSHIKKKQTQHTKNKTNKNNTSCSSHQLPEYFLEDLMIFPPIHSEMRTNMKVYISCVGNQKCYEFMSAISFSYIKDSYSTSPCHVAFQSLSRSSITLVETLCERDSYRIEYLTALCS